MKSGVCTFILGSHFSTIKCPKESLLRNKSSNVIDVINIKDT